MNSDEPTNNDGPNVDQDARPNRSRRVADVNAVQVISGSYRLARLDGYVFQIPDAATIYEHNNQQCIDALFQWFDTDAPGETRRITLHEYRLIRPFSGLVVDNVGQW